MGLEEQEALHHQRPILLEGIIDWYFDARRSRSSIARSKREKMGIAFLEQKVSTEI